MKGKLVPAVFLMLVLLIGFPSSIGDFNAFGDSDKQKDKAEKAKERAEKQKEKLKEKYDREIKRLEEKAKKLEEKQKAKYDRELKKLEEKAKKLEDYDENDDIEEFGDHVEIDYSSKTTAICHIPRGNPDNYRTIVVGTPAVKAHVAHGDSVGECDAEGDVVLDEYEFWKANKLAKLEEKRAKLEQKFMEKAQKFADKFKEKQNKRMQKILEKVQSGEYFDEFIEDEGSLRQFELTFDSLTAEPIGQPSEPLEFSGSITLVTSSSTDSRGTMKFKVTDCDIGDGGENSYSCKFGKARTTSNGPGGDKNGLVIIASLDDGNGGSVPGLKAFVSSDTVLRTLEEDHDDVIVTMHSPQSKIIHQWFLSGEGSVVVTNISPSITSITDYEAIHDDEDDVDDEIEIKGIVGSVGEDSLIVETEDGNIEVSVNDDTEFDEGFDLSNLEGLEVEIDAVKIDGNLVATEIEVEDDLDDDLDDEDDDDDDEEDDD
ncbi:MAG TPA: DUF5666 domain-containing protein [Nitrosopumilaceae archaeon]|nr:DUF5666 domain-containing protein [Nitrosopumilaceae archaeon]